ncbi:MAG: FtsQ-type POTRA domain-containing protein [Candidatus Pacebacteria bacterium]|nr:FtsQ-type POTRA domain-containing protein [Candidatus Paceibacterota bacterium]
MIAPRKFRTLEARKKARTRALVRVGVYIVLFACLCAALVSTLRADLFRVRDITVHGVEYLNEEDVAQNVRERMQGDTIGFIPKDSTFALQLDTLTQALRDAFPRIEEVSLERQGPQGLSLTIRERHPEALWCGDVVPPIMEQGTSSVAQGRCYVMDRTGFIYAEREGEVDMLDRYYGSLEKASPIGQYLLAEQEFAELRALHDTLRSKGADIIALLLVDERDMELYLTLPARVIVPRTLPVATMSERLMATLSSEAFDTSRALEYIDMRFETRVYVKYFDPIPESEDPSTASSSDGVVEEGEVRSTVTDEGSESVQADGSSTDPREGAGE